MKINSIGISILLLLLSVTLSAQIVKADPPIHMLLLIDCSASMGKADGADPEGLSFAAASYLLEQLALSSPDNKAAVITFSDSVHVLGQSEPDPSTALRSDVKAVAEYLSVATSGQENTKFRYSYPEDPAEMTRNLRTQIQRGGNTELALALELSYKIFSQDTDGAKRIIFLISDGEPFPDIKNSERIKQLESVLGPDIVTKLLDELKKKPGSVPGGVPSGSIMKLYSESILKKEAPRLSRMNIDFYPIALSDSNASGGSPTGLLSYLKKLSVVISGKDNTIEASSDNLINKLRNYIPMRMNYISYYYEKNFIIGRPKESNPFTLIVPEYAKKIRFFIKYHDSKSPQKINITLSDGYHEISQSKIEYNSMSRLRSHGILFSSLELDVSKLKSKKLTLKLSDGSRGMTEELPNADLYVDIQTDIEPEIFITGMNIKDNLSTINAGYPTDFIIKLFYNDELVPVEDADFFFNGKQERESSSNISEDGEVTFSMKNGIEESGMYDVRVSLILRDLLHSGLEPVINFKFPLMVESGSPPQFYLASVKAPKNPIKKIIMAEKNIFLLGTDSTRPINNISLEIKDFVNFKTGEDIYTELVKLEKNNYKVFNNTDTITIRRTFPDIIPKDLEDGKYTSHLIVYQNNREVLSVPMEFDIKIPRLLLSRKELKFVLDNKQFKQKDSINRNIRYPSNKTYSFSFPLISSSLKGANVRLNFAEESGIEQNEKDPEGVNKGRNSNVLFSTGKDLVFVPGKNSKKTGFCKFFIKLNDENLDGKIFTNTLYISSPGHRPREIKVKLEIKYLSAGWIRLAALIGLIGALLLIFYNRQVFSKKYPLKNIRKGSSFTIDLQDERQTNGNISIINRLRVNEILGFCKEQISTDYGTKKDVIGINNIDDIVLERFNKNFNQKSLREKLKQHGVKEYDIISNEDYGFKLEITEVIGLAMECKVLNSKITNLIFLRAGVGIIISILLLVAITQPYILF